MLKNGKFWARFMRPRSERFKKRIQNNLGIVDKTVPYQSKQFRKPELELYDAYYDNRQYCHLLPWDQQKDASTDEYIPVRQRAPRIKYAFAKTLTQRVTARLVGSRTFPSFTVEEDPDTEAYIKAILMASMFQSSLLEPAREMLAVGSGFIRFYVHEGQFVLQHYKSKFCYPTFSPTGELKAVTIKYVYDDESDLDENDQPIKKWYRLDLGEFADILYDNPVFDEESEDEPAFIEMNRTEHDLGFVQGEWIRTCRGNNPDGYSLIEDILDFIDDINYSLSQSSQAVSYNQDPQLVINGMSNEELEDLIRSSQKGWNLGKDGEAQFLETGLAGVERASELRDKMRLGINDIARVVFLDPEKMNAQNMSGKAMEILHGPLVELVEELRPFMEIAIKSMTLKMAITNLILADRGEPTPVQVPKGYKVQSLNLVTNWPPIFQSTMVDLKDKIAAAAQATGANLISRKTGTKYLAKDFNVEDVDAEIAEIAAQPVLNPFGAF